jgi:hypothetical protein
MRSAKLRTMRGETRMLRTHFKVAKSMVVALCAAAILATSAISLAALGAYLWPDPQSPMPAWIQAVGSIAAILASVGLIGWDRRVQQLHRDASEKTQLANLVLSTHLFLLSITRTVYTFRESGGKNSFIPVSALDYCINEVQRTIEQYVSIPYWKMDVRAAQMWNRAFRLASSIEAALLLVRFENKDSETAITSGVTNASLDWVRRLASLQSESTARYKELSGDDMPESLGD